MIVKFSEDFSKVTVRSSRYRAVDGATGKCDRCFFKNGFGCFLAEEILRTAPTSFNKLGLPRCQQGYRQDGRSIIWELDV